MPGGLAAPRQQPVEAIDIFDDDGWQEMPIIRNVDPSLALDEEDKKRYKYVPPEKRILTDSGLTTGAGSNATGNLIDFDDRGNEWREKLQSNEEDYTRLKLDEDEDADDAYLRTKYLFDEDKAMTPLSQMQATKNLLTEAQRIAYVGLCSLVAREMMLSLQKVNRKELTPAIKGLDLWRLKIMGRIYYHMELETDEQKMIESLAEHGVDPADLVPSLMTTHTVANPEYDPAEARQKAIHEEEQRQAADSASEPTTPTLHSPSDPSPSQHEDTSLGQDIDLPSPQTDIPTTSKTHTLLHPGSSVKDQTTANILQPNEPMTMPGVSTTLSPTDENVTLDIRWTVLCDLFLILIADSVYDARSRALLEIVAVKLGLGWIDVVRFEKRVTDALEIQEGAERLEQSDVIEGRGKAAKQRRYVMMGLATLGGGLVIGLSAGLLAPVIGAGLGAAFATIGVSGTGVFLGGTAGAAMITTGGVLTGSGIAARGMARRTQQVRTFDLVPLHNNKRVSCIITVGGFMAGSNDDVRLPFSVLDPLVGDVFSVFWEPEMMGEMGNALKILTSEVLSQVGTTVLQATVMTALMSALQWPIILTKLGYLIDNPWSNALDRAKAAGLVLADVLLNRSLGVRPITLIGYSLGARVIFYALVELAKQKAFGIVQDVFILGTTVTAPLTTWLDARGVVAGRFVNGYARNDWVLNYLFRATAGSLNTVAGLRPIENVPGLENVDVTDKIAGHLSYRTYMPVILDQLGFPVTATYFDEPEEPDMTGDREVIREEEAAALAAAAKKKNRFSLFRSKPKTTTTSPASPSTTPSKPSFPSKPGTPSQDTDDLPERLERSSLSSPRPPPSPSPALPPPDEESASPPSKIAPTAGFDFKAIGKAIGKADLDPNKLSMPVAAPIPQPFPSSILNSGLERSESAPPPLLPSSSSTPTPKAKAVPLPPVPSEEEEDVVPSLDTSSPLASSSSHRYPYQRSTSLGGNNPSLYEQPSAGPSLSSISSSNTPSHSTSQSYSYNSTDAPSWPPRNALLSFAGSDGSVWGAPSTATPVGSATSLTAQSLELSRPSSTSSEPQLSFGTTDGSISAFDSSRASPVERDPWAPPPPGLKAAIEKKVSYTLNPWET